MMSKFQIVLIGIFVLLAMIGVAFFATFKSESSKELPPVTLWGTMSENDFSNFLNDYNSTLSNQLHVTYVQKNEATFDSDYVQALARGEGPDAILVPQDLIIKEADKLIPIPYTTFSQRNFQDTFIQEGELFLGTDSFIALPFAVDPLVMYWNRDLFANEGLSTYPRTWDQFSSFAPRVTVRDNAANISRSAVALGEYQNINHAKDILAALFMQAGDSIVIKSDSGTQVVLGRAGSDTTSPGEAALSFYTSFANPSSPVYSWNRSLAPSKNAFIAGDLATYFGFASEARDIREKNPNLNFDVAPFPQLKSSKNYLTYGKMYAFALAKSTNNAAATFNTLSMLVSAPALTSLTNVTSLPPVRRDLLTNRPSDPFLAISYSSALVARAWLDPSSPDTDRIFQNIVESVTSGRSLPVEALSLGRNELQTFFK